MREPPKFKEGASDYRGRRYQGTKKKRKLNGQSTNLEERHDKQRQVYQISTTNVDKLCAVKSSIRSANKNVKPLEVNVMINGVKCSERSSKIRIES